MTAIIAVMGRKGGITKTTVATNLAAGCALHGLSSLLIETDGQANATSSIGLPKTDGFYQLMEEDAEWNDVILEAPDKFTGKPVDFSVVGAADQTRKVEESKDTPTRMVERLEELRGVYDVVIIDTSPGLTQIHTGCYYASDYVLLPTLCETDSIDSLDQTIGFMNEAVSAIPAGSDLKVADVLGIIPNRYVKGEKSKQYYLGFLNGAYARAGYTIFPFIRDLTAWGEARRRNNSIYSLKSGMDYNLRNSTASARREFSSVLDRVIEVAR